MQSDIVNYSDDPLVSVVMAVHNAKLLELKKSCCSILNQTYDNIEFIIIDDGNSKSVCDYLEELASKHSHILLLKYSQNRGLTDCLIKGIYNAKGVYIARQDADDFSSINRISEQVRHFKKNQSVCLLGTAYILENELLETRKIQCHALNKSEIIEQMYSINPFCHSSVMFSKKHYLAAGGYNKNLEHHRISTYGSVLQKLELLKIYLMLWLRGE